MKAVAYESVEDTPYPSQRAATTLYKCLLRGTAGAPDNYELFSGRQGRGGTFSPRHRHNFDQFRFALQSPQNFAPDKDIPVGQLGYFPEGTYYGPQQAFEGNQSFILQLGGGTGFGYLHNGQMRTGTEELKQKGEFEKGVYTFFVEGKKHNKDAYEAVWEHVSGKPVKYPKPRIDFPIVIDPEAYSWMPIAGSPGVSIRHLGTFNERGTCAFQYRIAKGGEARLAAKTFIRLLVVVSGRVGIADGEYGHLSCIELLPGENVVIHGIEDAVLLGFGLPDFSASAQT